MSWGEWSTNMLRGKVTEVDLKGFRIAFTVDSINYVIKLESELGNTADKLELIKPGMVLSAFTGEENSDNKVHSIEMHFLSYENTNKFSRIKVKKESLYCNVGLRSSYSPNKYESKTYFIDLNLPTLVFQYVEGISQKTLVIENNNNQLLFISDRMNGFQEVMEVLTGKWEAI